MRTIAPFSADQLRAVLDYNPETGIFLWKVSGKGHFANVAAGNKRPDGYIRINVLGHLFYAHRLAWLWMMGDWPSQQIDHVNCDPSDNSWKNLRAATPRQNRGNRGAQKNSISGIKGVYYREDCNKWVAYISPKGRTEVIGYFASLDDAKEARSKAGKDFFGDFSRDE